MSLAMSLSPPPKPTEVPSPVPRRSSTSPELVKPASSSKIPFPEGPPVQPRVKPVVAKAVVAVAIDDSPLSKASMIVNPPTPYTTPIHIPSPVLPTTDRSPNNATSSSRESSPNKGKDGSKRSKPSNSVVSKETETFRLVRSSSSTVSPTGETIVVHGEQWEVVGSPETHKKNKTSKDDPKRTKDGSQRESKRQERDKAQAAVQVCKQIVIVCDIRFLIQSMSHEESHSCP